VLVIDASNEWMHAINISFSVSYALSQRQSTQSKRTSIQWTCWKCWKDTKYMDDLALQYNPIYSIECWEVT